jgi:hypothetical protein
MSGYHETPVLVVGETPKQYRVEAIERMRLAGRMRWLNPGESRRSGCIGALCMYRRIA